jgi:glucose/arabinose dehydrogenase
MLYIATSGGDAQDMSSLGGKVLRVRDDGSAPSDNPFVGKDGARPEI